MILKNEIRSVAEKQSVPPSTIDKDWVLGHFVKAIYSLEEWGNKLAFKGGTCLHKCYIENYRFSEDLDFTTIDETFNLSEDLLKSLCKRIFEQAEIQTHIQSFDVLKFNEKPTGFEAKIKFWGANHARNETPPSQDRWTTSIKIEIIQFEVMIFDMEKKGIIHPYSDKQIIGDTKALCYSIAEVITEKLRSLIQRKYTAPRDYFDIWYLVNNNEKIDWQKIKEAFLKKVEFKNLEYKSYEDLLSKDAEQNLYKHWENNLKHQLKPELYIDPETVIKFCKKLFEEKM